MRVALALLLLAPGLQDDDPPDTSAAVHKSLRYASKQIKNIYESRKVKFDERKGTPYNATTAAVAGLAYVMADSGKYEGEIRYVMNKLKDYLRRAAKQEIQQENWPAAFAGFFFAELYLRDIHKKEAGRELKKIIGILEGAQKENGGWGHQKDAFSRGQFRTYPQTLTSSTNTVVACLGILKKAGLDVKKKTFESAKGFYAKAHLSDGGFAYDVSRTTFGSEVGRTAAALFALRCIGGDEKMEKAALAYVEKKKSGIVESHGSSPYHILHAVFADVKDWFPAVRDRILKNQQKEGWFKCICKGSDQVCNVTRHMKVVNAGGMTEEGKALFLAQVRTYVTVMYAVALQVEKGELKILE